MKFPVLLTCPDLQKGGGVTSYCQMLKQHLGADVDYFTIGARRENERVWSQIMRMVGDSFLFWRRVKRKNFSLVHLNPSLGTKALIRDGLLLLLAKASGCNVLVFMHGWDEECEAKLSRNFLRLFQNVYFRADAFIVLAQVFKAKLLAMGCNKPIFVETTTVEDQIFELQRAPRSDDRFHILYLSRIEKDKGIYETLEAYRLLKLRHPHVSLTVAGDGNELEQVRTYATALALEDIEFAGFVRGEEKAAAFCAADVYLFPTTYGEGMPTTVLEAMAYELPVVTRDVGGLKDFFENERMGFITDSKDPAVFADYLDQLLLNPEERKRIGRDNRLYAHRRFSASVVAARIRNIYQQIITGEMNG